MKFEKMQSDSPNRSFIILIRNGIGAKRRASPPKSNDGGTPYKYSDGISIIISLISFQKVKRHESES